jgi:cytochrome c551/c552
MKKLFILFILTHLQADTLDSLLFHGNCVTCHYKNEEKSAPSMYEVRKRYKTAFPNKKDFTFYMSQWVKHPNEKTSIMYDAIKKHGLMPQLGYEQEVLKDITSYIYETNFTQFHHK